jgi:probable phosphoglycerate mutase
MDAVTHLLLVRHGETQANIDGVWHGSTDTPLTDRGHRQAGRVATHLLASAPGVTAIHSSDLQRAVHTARPIADAFGHSVQTWPELREYDLGGWEGKAFADLHENYDLWAHMQRDPDYAPHGGESPRQVTSRLAGIFDRLADAHRGEKIVVVLHGGALAMILGHLLHGGHSNWQHHLSNASVSELVMGRGPELLYVDRTDHLEGL